MQCLEFYKIIIIDILTVLPIIAPTSILIINGIKCLLRSDMLQIYYRHKETDTIRQYELENFIFLYKAYKALKGNSFIDIIYKEVITWEVKS